ncbi:multiubiquitin domain-containing protein [Ancylobacter sp. FA202]|uniref:multiubiquitin domain-containing protein n=1 Tax=Ancylobacter sp. FA202 TaxID=1111106 RepID=UPI000584D653|nr:multiubiquitin domain-containing protein [Ancylobacter sp. FA202]
MDSKTVELMANRHQVTVNGQVYGPHDAEQTGRELLTLAGFAPASEYQLILVRANRTRLIGLEDKVNLKAEKGAVFRAFEGDRSYSWTLDEIGQVWGAPTLDVDELTSLFEFSPDNELVLERHDEPDVVLRPGGVISFEEKGVEHIVTRPKKPDVVLVTVFTTAGIFPAQGAVRARPGELVSTVLERAAKKLKLQDTSTWVVTVDGRTINSGLTFAQNSLSGAVELDWSPPEGGGGRA